MSHTPKNNRKRIIIFAVCFLAVLLILVISAGWLTTNRNMIVINQGIRYYNRLWRRLIAGEVTCLAVVAAALAVRLIRGRIRNRKQEKAEAQAGAAQREKKQSHGERNL